MDLETFLVSLFVLVNDRVSDTRSREPKSKRGRPTLLSESEVLTLASLCQWPRFRSERDFWRFADTYLRSYFPGLLSQSQLNRRIRALEPELKTLQRDLAATLADGAEVYHVLDTTLVPAVVSVRACRKGLFARQAAFGRCVSKTEWVYGFKVALSVSSSGVVTAFGLAEADSDERPIGEFLVSSDGYDAFLAEEGFLLGGTGETLVGALRSAGCRHSAGECPPGLAAEGPTVGRWKEATHRGRHRSSEGSVRSGAPPR